MTLIGTGRRAEQTAKSGSASLIGYTPIHSFFKNNVNKNEILYDRNFSLFGKAEISVRTNAEHTYDFEEMTKDQKRWLKT